MKREMLLVLCALLSSCVGIAGDGEPSPSLYTAQSEGSASWSQADPGGGGAVVGLASDARSVWAASDCGGLRRTTDDGATWTNLNRGLVFQMGLSPAKNIQAVALAKTDGAKLLFASSTAGIVYRFDFEQGRWNAVEMPPREPRDPADPKPDPMPLGTIAIDEEGEVFVGVGNTSSLSWGIHGNDVSKEPASPKLVFEGLESGSLGGRVLVLRRGGTAFELSSAFPHSAYTHVTGIAVAATAAGKLLFVSSTTGLWRGLLAPHAAASTIAWTKIPITQGQSPVQVQDVRSVALDPRNPNDLVALLWPWSKGVGGTRVWKGGVFRTTNALAGSDGSVGQPSWTGVSDGLPDSVAPDYKGSYYGRLYRGAVHPDRFLRIGTRKSPVGLDQGRLTGETIEWSAIFKDASQGWSKHGLEDGGFNALTFREDATGVKEIYAAGIQGQLFRGARDGQSFRFEQVYTTENSDGSYSGRGLPLMVPTGIAVRRGAPDRARFLYADNAFFSSRNGGQSFVQPVRTWARGWAAAIDPASGRAFVSYTKNNHLDEAEQGGIWEEGAADLDGAAGYVATSLCVATKKGTPRLFAARHILTAASPRSDRLGVYSLALEKGASWVSENAGLAEADLGDVYLLAQGRLVDAKGPREVLFLALRSPEQKAPALYYRYLDNLAGDPGRSYSKGWLALDTPAGLRPIERMKHLAESRLCLVDRTGKAFCRATDAPGGSWIQIAASLSVAGESKIQDLAACGGTYYLATFTQGIQRLAVSTPEGTPTPLSLDGVGGYLAFSLCEAEPRSEGGCRLYAGTDGGDGVFRLDL